MVRLQLLEGGAQRLVGDSPDVLFHLVEPHHAEFHPRVENRHLVLAVDQRERVVEPRLAQGLVGDAALIHLVFPPACREALPFVRL